jgi:membrane protein DedA with SNARE-associated domain
MIDLGALLREHVYVALAVGSAVEGETAVVLAGYAAHRGYASLPVVIGIAAALNFAWDQFYFLIGQRQGERLLARIPRLRIAVDRLEPRIRRHRHLIIPAMRFMYGLRIAGPIALGIARVPWLEFLALNALGAAVWACTFALLGYAFGEGVSVLIGRAAHYESHALLAILLGGILFGLWHWWRHRRTQGDAHAAR